MKVGTGFQTSKILLSAVKKGLFTKLAESPMTGEQIRRGLDLDGRGFKRMGQGGWLFQL